MWYNQSPSAEYCEGGKEGEKDVPGASRRASWKRRLFPINSLKIQVAAISFRDQHLA